MFNSEIRLVGKHANYARFLSGKDEANDIMFFDRNIDIVMIGAVVGFIYGRSEEVDDYSEHKDAPVTKVFFETVIRESNNLNFIYRTIMLLENKDKLSSEERINRAFRDEYSNKERHQENMNIFNSYVRGGISLLYEKITSNAYDINEYLRNLKDFVDDFHNDFISEKYLEDIVYEEL